MQCPHCQQQHPDGSRFCPVTGKALPLSIPQPGNSSRVSRWLIWLFIILAGFAGVAILAVLGFLVLWNVPAQPNLVSTSIPQQISGSFPGGWSTLGPEGGEILCLVFDPANSATLYAGTNGQGVFISEDGGFSWNSANTGFADSDSLTIRVLAIDPDNPAILYAGTNAGLFKSRDGGASWVAVNNGLGGDYANSITQLLIDPANPSTLYAASGMTGLNKSSDGGESWQALNLGEKGKYISALAIDPISPTTLYAGTYENSPQEHGWRRQLERTPL